MHLLVAEADPSLAEFLQTRLQQEHFAVHLASSCDQFPRAPDKTPFDLIVLDHNIVPSPAPDLVRKVQNLWPDPPIVLLSATNSVEERVKALDAGADDFLAKPFALAELIARVRAVLRRRTRPTLSVLQFEDLEVNRVSHEVRRAGRSIELSPKEYALLEYLLRNPGRPVTRTAIIEDVWRIQGDSLTNVVDVYINYLRRKIDNGADRPLIRTIRGVGYQIGGNHNGRAA